MSAPVHPRGRISCALKILGTLVDNELSFNRGISWRESGGKVYLRGGKQETHPAENPQNQPKTMKATTLKSEKINENITCLREIPNVCNGKEWIIASYTKVSQGWQLNKTTVKYYLTKKAAEKAWAKMQNTPKASVTKKEKSPTVAELKAKCKALGIKKYSTLKKAELLTLLATHA